MKNLALTIPGPSGPVEIGGPPGIPTGSFTGDSPTGNILLNNILLLSFAIAVVATLIVIVWGGMLWVTSRGDKEKLASARNRIIYAIAGLVLIFLSAFIVNLILFFFGKQAFQ